MHINKTSSALNDSPIGKFLLQRKATFEEAIKTGKIKIIPTTTLFPDEWTAAQKYILFKNKCCPYCAKGLKFALTRPIARCGRKRCSCPHRGGFVIRIAVLEGHLEIQ